MFAVVLILLASSRGSRTPRVMEQLFDMAGKTRAKTKYESVSREHWNHPHLLRHVLSVVDHLRFHMSIMEIYNNAAFDLLMSKAKRSVLGASSLTSTSVFLREESFDIVRMRHDHRALAPESLMGPKA